MIKDIDGSFIEKHTDLKFHLSGVGYYTTFVCDEVVVKRYPETSKHLFDKDMVVHRELDDFYLVPKLLGYYKDDKNYYLILNKITPVCDQSIHLEELRDFAEKHSKEIENHTDRCANLRFLMRDKGPFNYGYDKNGNFMCLDEGCFNYCGDIPEFKFKETK